MKWTFNLPWTITFQFGDYFHKGGIYWCGKPWFEEMYNLLIQFNQTIFYGIEYLHERQENTSN
jgi:hypothetical protein